MSPPIKIPDVVGHVYGRWTVLGHHQQERRGTWTVHTFLCRCSCGTEKRISYGNLRNKQTRSCGCLRAELIALRQTKPNLYGCKVAAYGHYRTNAAKRGFDFHLTMNEAISLMEGPCHYCGALNAGKVKKHKQEWPCNGIDRIDSTAGYTLDNCVSCCKKCNNAKSSMPIHAFRQWIRDVHDWQAKNGW